MVDQVQVEVVKLQDQLLQVGQAIPLPLLPLKVKTVELDHKVQLLEEQVAVAVLHVLVVMVQALVVLEELVHLFLEQVLLDLMVRQVQFVVRDTLLVAAVATGAWPTRR